MKGVQAKGLGIALGGRSIVSDVRFHAPAGQITALIGPNGAGKSTLLRLVGGILRSNQGDVTFDGQSLPAMSGPARAKIVALVEQDLATDAELNAQQAVMLGRIPFQSAWSRASRDDQAIVDEAMRATGCVSLAMRRYATLSGGERQKVQLARALAQQPSLILLDEPTNHLDIEAQLAMLTILKQRADDGATVLAALHDLNLAAGCDHVVALDAGSIIAEGPPEAVLAPERISALYGVRAAVIAHPLTENPLIAFAESGHHGEDAPWSAYPAPWRSKGRIAVP